MELPKNIILLCNFGGDVLQKPDELNIKTVFELIDEQSLPMFHDYIQTIFKNGDYVKVRTVKLLDGNEYFLNTEVMNMKMNFNFTRCNSSQYSDENSSFWMDTIFKYEYYLKRYSGVIRSVSNLIEKLFYKNRSNIEEVITELHKSLKLKYSLLLFRNGHDHAYYYMDNGLEENKKIEKNESFLYDDKKFESDIVSNINDIMKVKYIQNTYLYQYTKDNNNTKVYVLKLLFGPKIIGYFEFIPYSYIMFTPVEIYLIQSLSNVLAYIIHNKNEQLDIENYINTKLK